MRQIIEQIAKSLSYPLFMTAIEILILASCIWGITNFIPHQVEPLKNLNLLTWIVCITCYKLFTYKYSTTDEEQPTQPEEETVSQIPLPFSMESRPVLQKEPEIKPGPPNIKPVSIYEMNKVGEGTSDDSTRE
jgi:Ca2+/Na+ antiporter